MVALPRWVSSATSRASASVGKVARWTASMAAESDSVAGRTSNGVIGKISVKMRQLPEWVIDKCVDICDNYAKMHKSRGCHAGGQEGLLSILNLRFLRDYPDAQVVEPARECLKSGDFGYQSSHA
jgi:hypothetical protein